MNSKVTRIINETLKKAQDELNVEFKIKTDGRKMTIGQDTIFDGGETVVHNSYIILDTGRGTLSVSSGWPELGYETVGQFTEDYLGTIFFGLIEKEFKSACEMVFKYQ